MFNPFQEEKLQHLFNIIDYDHNGLVQKSDFIGLAENIEIFTGIIYDKKTSISLIDDSKRIWSSICHYFGSDEIQHIDINQWLEYIYAHFFSADTNTIKNNINYLVARIHQVFDRDKDVKISRLEFMCIFVSCRVEVKHANLCFDAIDSNSDNFISYKELEIALEEFFKSTKPVANGNLLFGELGSSHFKSVTRHFRK